MTTRKEVFRIAGELELVRPKRGAQAQFVQWLKDVEAVADALEITGGYTPNGNRAFQRDKFYEACGVLAEVQS